MSVEPQLADWESFYVIVGSCGGALVGIQFVVITLIVEVRRRAQADAIGAFATPTVVHFGAVLAISAIMSAPWHSLGATSALLAACGLFGLAYGVVVIRRLRRQTDYQPEWDDWAWYFILPGVAYALLAVVAPFLPSSTGVAATTVAGLSLGLLLIGIRNAWDSVTHIVITARDGGDGEAKSSGGPAAG